LKALGFRQVLQVHDEIILEVRIISSISDDSKISF
jgi:DNA polymerase I-like protein with 3'-5' exonuclease and polymerase domains